MASKSVRFQELRSRLATTWIGAQSGNWRCLQKKLDFACKASIGVITESQPVRVLLLRRMKRSGAVGGGSSMVLLEDGEPPMTNPTKKIVEQSKPVPKHAKGKTKASIFEALLERKDGVSLEALCKATGWQTHSCRAFLTGLRKKGREVVRHKDAKDTSIYKMTPLPTEKARV